MQLHSQPESKTKYPSLRHILGSPQWDDAGGQPPRCGSGWSVSVYKRLITEYWKPINPTRLLIGALLDLHTSHGSVVYRLQETCPCVSDEVPNTCYPLHISTKSLDRRLGPNAAHPHAMQPWSVLRRTDHGPLSSATRPDGFGERAEPERGSSRQHCFLCSYIG